MMRATCCLIVVGFVSSLGVRLGYADGHPGTGSEAKAFDLADVELLDGPFRDAMLRTRKYLHELESERLLFFFRKNAGLPAPGTPLGGWEDTAVKGHTMGHYLSACARMYASTGDEALKSKADSIVRQLAKCQDALGTGYLSAFPESHIDRAIARQPVWAPWYTLHKILAGLLDMHVYCANEQALNIARKMAVWTQGRLDKLSDEEMQAMLNTTEQGGMNDALANLYALTGDEQWLALSRRFNQESYLGPLREHRDQLANQHANSFIPNIVGTARQYEVGGSPLDRQMAEYFWDIVVHGRSYCTGGTSIDEHFHGAPNQLCQYLGSLTQENCCTYNLLKLTRHLFSWDPRPEYFDYYERALFNAVLATQDPETAMMTYFVTVAPGRWKFFNTPRDSFWCCTGSGLESHSQYGNSIYYHQEDVLWVNLFIASEVRWREKQITVRQTTGFPDSGSTTLVVDTPRPLEFEMRVRVPHWCGKGATISINGERQAVCAQPSSYVAIRRAWKTGDRIDIDLPMNLWLCPASGDADVAAIMVGPLVLAGRLRDVDVPKEMLFTTENWFHFPAERLVDEPLLVTADRDPTNWIQPVANQPLTFRTVGVGRPRDVTLVPFFRLFRQQYAIYWRFTDEETAAQVNAQRRSRRDARARETALRAELEQRSVDSVAIRNTKSEEAHHYRGENSNAGNRSGFNWRDAASEGWFEYRLKVACDAPNVLLCRYWGSDDGRSFDILVDGMRLATEHLQRERPDELIDRVYEIPASWTQGKEVVTVRFSGTHGTRAGGVFGCSTHKASGR